MNFKTSPGAIKDIHAGMKTEKYENSNKKRFKSQASPYRKQPNRFNLKKEN